MNLERRISVLIIIIFILTLGLIITSTPRTEVIYNANVTLYPDIINVLDKVSNINLQNKEKTLSFKKNNTGDWEIINKDNFPAQMNLVNDLLLGVANLKVIEQKTKDPKLYSLLQVDDVTNENSNAIAMTLKDLNDNILVNLLVGKRERQTILGSKAEQLYIRKDGDPQSWLVEGNLPVSLEFKDWVNQPLLPITANDIQKIIISNNYSKDPVVIYKETNDGDFYVKETTEKIATITPIQQNNILIHKLSNIEYYHVIGYDKLSTKWQPSLKLEIHTAHKFNIKIEMCKTKKHIYARVLVSFVGDDKNIQDPIRYNKLNKINAFSELWLFHISDEIYNLVNQSQQDLVTALKT